MGPKPSQSSRGGGAHLKQWFGGQTPTQPCSPVEWHINTKEGGQCEAGEQTGQRRHTCRQGPASEGRVRQEGRLQPHGEAVGFLGAQSFLGPTFSTLARFAGGGVAGGVYTCLRNNELVK